MLKKIYRLSEITKITGLGRSSIYLALSKGEFPKPIRLGKRAIGWQEEAIQKWLDKLNEVNNEDT